MISWLHHLPDMVIFYLFTIPLVLVVVYASILGHQLWFRKREDSSSFELMDGFIAVSSAIAVVLAFSLVEVDSTYREVEDNIAHEVGAIDALDRTVERYGRTGELASLRGQIIAYVKLIIDDEWHQMHEGTRSPKADAVYDDIASAVRKLEPASEHQTVLFNEGLTQLDRMWDLRELRVEAAHIGLPPLFWKSMVAMFAVLVLIAMHIEPSRKRIVGMAGITATLGLLLALVVIIDAPFAGDSPVSPEEFQRLADTVAKRQ